MKLKRKYTTLADDHDARGKVKSQFKNMGKGGSAASSNSGVARGKHVLRPIGFSGRTASKLQVGASKAGKK